MPENIWLVTDKGLERTGVDLPYDAGLCRQQCFTTASRGGSSCISP
jgi:hypothetical protein